MASSSRKPHDHCKGSADTAQVGSERQELVHDEEETCLDTMIEADDFDRDNVDKCVGLANSFVESEVLRAEDVLHMEFNNPEEASRFYNEYGRARGFSIRQGKKIKNSKGEFVRYTYLCNREGFRDKKWLEKSDRKREHKVVTRCGCLAEMRIKRKAESGKWYVSRFVDEHNHEAVPARYLLGPERVDVNQTGDMTALYRTRLWWLQWKLWEFKYGIDLTIALPLLFEPGIFLWFHSYFRLRMASSSRKLHDHCKRSADTIQVGSERQDLVDDEEETSLDTVNEPDDIDGDNVDKCVRLDDGFIESEVLRAEDVLHMEFNDPEEASRFYNEYGRAKGFAIRQGKKIKNSKGEFVWYTYLCNREGFRDKKWLDKSDRKRDHKAVTRCGCLAEMRIKRKAGSGKWYVSRFVDEHNHEAVPPRYLLGPGRVVNQTGDMTALYRTRVDAFVHLCKRLAKAACLTDEDYKLYTDRILRDTILLEIKNGLGVEVVRGSNVNAEVAKDPIHVGTKGTGCANEASGSKGTKKRKCSTWGRRGHRRTRFPNGSPSTALPGEDAVQDRTGHRLQNGVMGQQEFVKRKRTVDFLPPVSFAKFL
ncbi:hypothetical protein Ahy_A09g045557 isoform C [Arachis hypogaea]|uniref:FAR1 domain-containing protein n=1 Tax=Arachis hypogaea TaxID=3818 RepID=A0A445BML3_ARAHY|nr:hypothetical protein Ahy_A09g045557 isoform C [Arachis hypogaea]